MQDFIVLGIIPGTNIQLDFNDTLNIYLILILAYALVSYLIHTARKTEITLATAFIQLPATKPARAKSSSKSTTTAKAKKSAASKTKAITRKTPTKPLVARATPEEAIA